MKITIYELLGLIKDGKAPKIIKDDEYIYTLREQFNDYWNEESYLLVNGFDDYENTIDFLNSKVEIIEEVEDKLIPDHISNEFIQSLDKEMIKHIAHKVNEIINYLQHISKENK